MKDLRLAHFVYTAVVKQDQGATFDAVSIFPGLDELTLRSRIFPNYAESVTSCKKLLTDVTANINEGFAEPKFKLGIEVHPAVSGQKTISKDWGDDEVSRFWVYDKGMEGQSRNISALCRGSIFAIDPIQGQPKS